MNAMCNMGVIPRVYAHRAPDPEPVEEPLPEPRPVPEQDPVPPDHNPSARPVVPAIVQLQFRTELEKGYLMIR